MNYNQNYVFTNDGNSIIKISIMNPQNNNSKEMKDLSGLLKVLSIKKLSNNIDSNKLPQNLKDFFLEINKNIHFTGDKNIE